MKHKIDRILFVILVVWLLIFITDIVCFYSGSTPLFMITFYGGEVTEYIGLGYAIEEVFPLTSIEDPMRYSSSINILPYIVVNTIVVVSLILRKIRQLSIKQAEM